MAERPEDPRRQGGGVQAWIEAHRGRLPETYDAFAAHSMDYRRAIFAELSPEVRSRLWTEHVTRYRESRADLSPEQDAALAHALELFSDPGTFAEVHTGPDPVLDRLKAQTIAAFGFSEAAAIIATLGPPDEGGTPPRS
ncbi:bacteriocin fulvocin C-related protein [Nocardiopsis nanhaiensis]